MCHKKSEITTTNYNILLDLKQGLKNHLTVYSEAKKILIQEKKHVDSINTRES